VLTKRIVPCLDIQNGRTVKGINFINLRDAGDPVELAAAYAEQGADELVFLDISATTEKRKTLAGLVKKVARQIDIPFTVGGGVGTVEDVRLLLNSGADKVCVNSSAAQSPSIINELARNFGTQCIVLAIDAREINSEWIVHTHGGRTPTSKKLFEWAREGEERGAGEILFTSMDHDGTRNGFAVAALTQLNEITNLPVIASGGAGNQTHFMDAFKKGKADAALAASIFHFGEVKIPDLKKYLTSEGINMRD
jgi:cyclase